MYYMKTITTPIIPEKQTFFKVNAPHELDLKAICVFAAIGFFLDEDTYYHDTKVLRPGTKYTLDENDKVVNSNTYFNWYYEPRNISFEQALDEFSTLFEAIIQEQTAGKKVILPLSGGLDSRTQAVALKKMGAQVFSYSYEFENGYPETKIAEKIAKSCGFEFQKYKIKKGYLWEVIDDLVEINGCYSDFTSPRQMAIRNEFAKMGAVFSLGHWGDVLFDAMNLPELSHEHQVDVLMSKLLKRGGLEFAESLWQVWELEGHFKDYLRNRVTDLLNTIDIDDTNARLRAFKSKYWAPRWTSVNLAVFNNQKPMSLPYYDNRICEFICTVPESYLKDRQLQIEYMKRSAPELAKIEWQVHRPFNLYNYHLNKPPYNLPYRMVNKLKREIKALLGNPYVQRNWELQFLGKDNAFFLKQYILESGLDTWISKTFLNAQLSAFLKGDALKYAHTINMLLTLSLFNKKQRHA
ncbi:asparagine synthase-related protein [Seonamhaeicola aphaedonensis]|uniref:asparagine synthase (glutamine-hydrolyzing) n=1 Tax=Seonamhaeicola aphaedonensis TaxID=1461338 RepID=A0A3D9HFU2_9FLAO|nr:asparagine synthase C-terminal domain-containing protein [Seonamhaeicola aphaedonensis]RED48359.1 asparagine synthase [Seonamhaeicola aphaedonensis]